MEKARNFPSGRNCQMNETDYIQCPCLHCGQHIEFPASAIGETVECPHCGQQTMLHRPAARAIVPPPTQPPENRAEGGTVTRMRLTRTTAIAALIILCCLGAAVWVVENWRVHETEAEKTRTALVAELRLLEADLKTGINQSDFLHQVARVRAAYDEAKANLNQLQNERFAEIDLDMTACIFFWDEEIKTSQYHFAAAAYDGPARIYAERLNLKMLAEVGMDVNKYLSPSEMAELLKHDPNRFLTYYPKPCVEQVMGKIGEAIHSFLNDGSIQ